MSSPSRTGRRRMANSCPTSLAFCSLNNIQCSKNDAGTPLHTATLLRVLAFGEFLDDLVAKSRQVTWLAAGDQAVVGDHFFVHPIAAGVANVGLQTGKGCQRASTNQIGFHQCPRAVANDTHRLVLLEETADELNGICNGAQRVGTDRATGHDEAVI